MFIIGNSTKISFYFFHKMFIILNNCNYMVIFSELRYSNMWFYYFCWTFLYNRSFCLYKNKNEKLFWWFRLQFREICFDLFHCVPALFASSFNESHTLYVLLYSGIHVTREIPFYSRKKKQLLAAVYDVIIVRKANRRALIDVRRNEFIWQNA